MTQHCVNATCVVYGLHREAGCWTGCTGCQPRPAAVGRLCRSCTDGIGHNARAAAVAWHQLEDELVATGSGGGGGGGNPFPSMSFDPRVAETRATISHTLTSWTKLIHDETGYQLPQLGYRLVRPHDSRGLRVEGPDERIRLIDVGLDHLAAYIAHHTDVLARHETAADACEELAHLAWLGGRQQDHPNTGTFEIRRPCPRCDGQLRAVVRRDAGARTETVCDGPEPHRWAGEQHIAELGREVGARDGWLSAREIARRYGRPLGTVKRWISTEGWRRTQDGQTPTLFHPADVDATATRLATVAA